MSAATTTRKSARGKAAQTNSEVRPPEEYKVEDKVDPSLPVGLYPDGAKLFTYTSKTTGETISLPLEFDSPKAVWVWDLYDKPFHVQTWEWMKLANVPRMVQRKAVQLLDDAPDEYLDLFNSWLDAVGGVSAGE